jgi:hypothetical protein
MASSLAKDHVFSGGRVRAGKWVPAKRICPRPAQYSNHHWQWDASSLHRPYNVSIDHNASAAASQAVELGNRAATRQCGQRLADRASYDRASYERTHAVPIQDSRPRASCADSVLPAGIQLLLGVHNAPASRQRRDAIRGSWMRWPSVGRTTVVCFLLGQDALAPVLLQSLLDEQKEFGDLLMLPNASDDCILSIPKAYAWWQQSARMLSKAAGVLHVAKVDDDSFVHVPNLEAEVAALRCHSQLYYGVMAHTGFNPLEFNTCGFSWMVQQSCGAVESHRMANGWWGGGF